jgi:phosphate transport system substrate-binding protein
MLFVPVAFAESLTINGASSPIKGLLDPGKTAFKSASGIELNLVISTSGGGIEALAKGKCDAAVSGDTLEATLKSLKDVAPDVVPPADLKDFVLGYEFIRIMVHPSNSVKALTKEQLKGIYTGKITNWKDVGGKDETIVAIASPTGTATRTMFQKKVMDGDAYFDGVTNAESAVKQIDLITVTPEGIAMAPSSMLVDKYKGKYQVVEAPEMKKPFLLITKGAPTPSVKKVIEHFTQK